MSALATLLGDFHAAILDNAPGACAAAIRPHPRLSAAQQMAIYTQGYRLRLSEVIGNEYPATRHLLGDDAFSALAAAFIEATPPSHYSLDTYPQGFAAYLQPHAMDGCAADIAALEAAIAHVFHAPESAALDAHALQGLTPDAFAARRLAPRAASALLAFAYPVEDYLTRLRNGETPARPEALKSYIFVVRHPREVKRHALGEAQYRVLLALSQGACVGDALEQVAQAHPALLEDIASNVQHWFTQWTSSGFFQHA